MVIYLGTLPDCIVIEIKCIILNISLSANKFFIAVHNSSKVL